MESEAAMRESAMKGTGSLVDQLEELVGDVTSLGDTLARTAEDLRMARSFYPQGVAAGLAEARKAMLGLAARLAEMERSLSRSAGIASELEAIPPAGSPVVSPEATVSLRPAGPEERASAVSPAGAALGPQWEQAEARLSGLTQFIERALRAESASDAAMNLGNLALQYHRQKKFEEAERLYQHALAFREKFFGPEHSSVATGLNNLAILMRDQGRYEEAAALLHRSLAITEKTWGPDHPKVARRLSNLANLALQQGELAEAKRFFERILVIGEKHRLTALPEVRASLKKYAETLERAGRVQESAELFTRIQAIKPALDPEIESF
jgi:tetratricopeptide (TPR) repeat protein